MRRARGAGWWTRTCLVGMLALAGGVAACGGDSSSGPPGPLAGRWRGTGNGITFDMTLTDQDARLSGDGSLTGASISGGGVGVLISGTRTGMAASMQVSAQGYTPATYSGALTDDSTFGGLFNGSGFGNFPLTVHRIP
jgi:hypothetical protein